VLLEINGVTRCFGGLTAISDLDMYVKEGEIAGLIGPNGAGKTTLFNLITGFFHPNNGTIVYDGKDITKMKPHSIAKLGIGRTFQLNPLFYDFTVLQNVVASFYLRPRSSLWSVFLNTSTYRHNEAQISAQSMEILKLVGLYEVRDEPAKNLPHGFQKMLGIARALAVQPRLLLLDEPIGGMNPDEIEFTMKAIDKTRHQGVTILLVEHNMKIMDLCDRVTVISFGRKIAEGSVKEVRENQQVVEAYFGSSGGLNVTQSE
jgi:branched-chain amino acid transport system ATP-binding protein